MIKSDLLPGLYVVATPIGNLGDMTGRAKYTLEKSNYILCEDTRNALKLLRLNNIELKNLKLVAYHDYNETEQSNNILSILSKGNIVSLISDAGTPCIADPGYKIVAKCHENHIPVFSVPGPCAAIAALSIAGIPCENFQFLGFLPKKQEQKRQFIEKITSFSGTSVLYESPLRVKATLELISELSNSDITCALCRETTKKYEEIIRGKIKDVLLEINNKNLKGEFTIIINNHKKIDIDQKQLDRLSYLLKILIPILPVKEIIIIVQDLMSFPIPIPKNIIYDMLLTIKSNI